MSITVYNTLSRKKENFKPLRDKQVGMYVCGPTVYGPSHLGHARTYIAFDIIRRYLEWRGFKVTFVSNITDIHDDIINEAQRRNVAVKDLADQYAKEFFDDLTKLEIKKADFYPRVTNNISEIIALIEKLFERGLAYKAADNSIYYAVSRFKNYGRLSGIKLKKAKTGTRVETDKYEKAEAADFALWKEETIAGASWPSPWGQGRPGWHIECSAMSQKYLGTRFDIHGGARDLIFPHHENEIAQSEGAAGKSPFVKYWIHSGLLTIEGQKMSKSLKNFIELRDIFKEYEPRVLRYLVTSVYYRSPLNFSYALLKQAKSSLERIDEFKTKMQAVEIQKTAQKTDVDKILAAAKKKFMEAMDNDFNTPKALAVIFDLIKKINKRDGGNDLTQNEARKATDFLDEINEIFVISPPQKTPIPKVVSELARRREEARRTKNFEEADRFRAEIEKSGFKVEDTPQGPRLFPL